MKRFVVIVLDGFGIGAMDDAKTERPGDEGANTLGSILKDYPDLRLPTLEKLGLMNAFGAESRCMKFSPEANYGKSKLMHLGQIPLWASGDYGNFTEKAGGASVSGESR